MSRRSRRSSTTVQTNSKRVWRDVKKSIPIARRRLPRHVRSDLRLFEDRRLFHPDEFRPATSFSVVPTHFKIGEGIRVGSPNVNVSRPDRVVSSVRVALPHRIGFESPKAVVMCARRQRRREVLHALGKAGRGGLGRNRKRRLNEYSQVSC